MNLIDECRLHGPARDGWFHIEDYERLGFTRRDVKKAADNGLLLLDMPQRQRARWRLAAPQKETTE